MEEKLKKEDKCPISEWSKKPNNIVLFWFIFIIFFIGQFGPISEAFKLIWEGKNWFSALDKASEKGALITCSTAILASSIIFLVKEYTLAKNNSNDNPSDEEKAKIAKKSLSMLLTTIIGLFGIIFSTYLISGGVLENGFQKAFHWIVYILSLVLSLLWFKTENEEIFASAFNKQIIQSSDNLNKSQELNPSKSGGKF